MKTYTITMDWSVEVEAENEQDAIQKGFEQWQDNTEDGMYLNAKELKEVRPNG